MSFFRCNFFFVCCFYLYVDVFSQQQISKAEKSELEKTFDKVFYKEQPEEKPVKQLILGIGANELPGWFFDATSTHDTIYSIGISDPLAPQAFAQAYQRSVATMALMAGAVVTGLSDNYSSDVSGKFEEIIKCRGDSILTGKVMVTDSFTTKFGEKILLLRIIKNTSDSIRVNIFLEQYKSVSKVEYGYINLTKVDFNCKYNKSENLNYNFTQCDRDFSIKSVFNNLVIDIPPGMYEYTGTALKISTDSLSTVSIRLAHKGLWLGYLKSFTDNLSILASNNKPKIKSLEQNEVKSDNTGSSKSLQRSIMNNKFSFKIYHIEIIDNELNVVLNNL